jgi:hypothetical protein
MNRDELVDWLGHNLDVYGTWKEMADDLLPLIERECRNAVVTELREQAGGLELVANIRERDDRAESAAAWGWASVTLNRRADEIEGEGVAMAKPRPSAEAGTVPGSSDSTIPLSLSDEQIGELYDRWLGGIAPHWATNGDGFRAQVVGFALAVLDTAVEQADAPVDFTDGTWAFRTPGSNVIWFWDQVERDAAEFRPEAHEYEAIKITPPVRVRVVTDTRIEQIKGGEDR